MRASISSPVGPGSSTLNHGRVFPLLQQVPSQFKPSQSGLSPYTPEVTGSLSDGFPDSQYQLLPTYGGGEAPGKFGVQGQ